MTNHGADTRAYMRDLNEKIGQNNTAYYDNDSPKISDMEYDKLVSELAELEKDHPEYVDYDSNIKKVGSGKGGKIEHRTKMLSLANTYSAEDLSAFFSRMRKHSSENLCYSIEPKIDGLALSVYYEDGKLIYAATRGNGTTGDDVTDVVRACELVPEKLFGKLSTLEIRGEVFMTFSAFSELNKIREGSGLSVFANARNAAAGSLKLKDPVEAKTRGLSFLAHSIGFDDTNADNIELLDSMGFATFCRSTGIPHVDITPYVDNGRDVKPVLDSIENTDYGYPIDGAVIKVAFYDLRDRIGHTEKSPSWAVAYKFATGSVNTTLKDVEWSVGKSGTVTPVAVLEPVSLGGVTISRASLYNAEQMMSLDLRPGCLVSIERGGEVIPKVTGVIERPETNSVFIPPLNCPVCGKPLTKEGDKVALKCTNSLCLALIQKRIEHFVSRNAMDIDGLGPAIVEAMLSWGLIETIPDIYELSKEDLLKIPKFGEKSADNLLNSIAQSKNRPLHRVIYALGIPHIGEKAAKDLAKHVDSLFDPRMSEPGLAINILGNVAGVSVDRFYRDPNNTDMLTKLEQAGLNLRRTDLDTMGSTVLEGKTFVFTGTLEKGRKEIESMVENLGGKASSSVSKRTSYVVTGENAGSKKAKAEKLGVTIMSEKEFMDYISEIS